MGYTIYWTLGKRSTEKQEEQYRRALKHCNKVIQKFHKEVVHLSGYSAHSSKYAGIKFNGKSEYACEDFILRAELWEGDRMNFCKTLGYAYTVPVWACLLILKHYLKHVIVIQSDGHDSEEKCMALKLLKKYGKLKIRSTILREL
jgi:hypothetical protein